MLWQHIRTITTDGSSPVETLPDNFERLGPDDTPFTLRGGAGKREHAEAVHQERSPEEQVDDERSNEPITRSISDWEQDLSGLDFPYVDTIPHDTHLERAQEIATTAQDYSLIDEIQHEVPFDNQDIYGKFWPNIGKVEVAPDRDFFPGYAPGPTLAHEVSHSIYAEWTPDAGFEDGQQVLKTQAQQEQAEMLSERLYGPFSDTTGPIMDYRRGDEELFAAVFTSRVIEPRAARRNASQAIDRIEEIVVSIAPDLLDSSDTELCDS